MQLLIHFAAQLPWDKNTLSKMSRMTLISAENKRYILTTFSQLLTHRVDACVDDACVVKTTEGEKCKASASGRREVISDAFEKRYGRYITPFTVGGNE